MSNNLRIPAPRTTPRVSALNLAVQQAQHCHCFVADAMIAYDTAVAALSVQVAFDKTEPVTRAS